MAITLKKKPAPEPAKLSKQELKDLVAAGLVEAPAEPIAPQFQLHVGTRVVVNHGLFPWVPHYKEGDTGTVLSITTAKDKVLNDIHRYDLVAVRLDTPHTDEVVTLSRWELAPEPTEQED